MVLDVDDILVLDETRERITFTTKKVERSFRI